MMGEIYIDYESLEQEARRGIVRTVLARVAALGRLPGEHHFYIAFDTRAPGVVVSRRLREKYPEEMTIVLQYQYSNLTVGEDRFEVTLSFNNVPERLTVPFRAVRVFFDPSVPYGLQFDSSDLVAEAVGEVGARDPARAGVDISDGGRRNGAALPAARDNVLERREPGESGRANGASESDVAHETSKDTPAALHDRAAEAGGAGAQRRQPGRPKLVRARPDEPANDAKVVQLDKFRKR